VEVREGPGVGSGLNTRRAKRSNAVVGPVVAVFSAAALVIVIAGCGSSPTAHVSSSPTSQASLSPSPATPSPTDSGATPTPPAPSPSPCSRVEPLPGLCVGRAATPQEEAAMIAVGKPAIEADYGWPDWSACVNGQQCYEVGSPSRAMVGTNAGTFYGIYGQYPGGGLGSPCWVFLFEDAGGWHYVNAGCAQARGYVPGPGDRVFVNPGCANVRDAPGLSAKVLACLNNGTVVDVDGAPTFVDGHIWWHLAGHGWMAHDFLVAPKNCHC
jgi:hypothetical protein